MGRNDCSSSYKNLNNYDILILTHSVLNDEFISNYKRVVVLSSHEVFDGKKYVELSCGKIRKKCYEN